MENQPKRLGTADLDLLQASMMGYSLRAHVRAPFLYLGNGWRGAHGPTHRRQPPCGTSCPALAPCPSPQPTQVPPPLTPAARPTLRFIWPPFCQWPPPIAWWEWGRCEISRQRRPLAGGGARASTAAAPRRLGRTVPQRTAAGGLYSLL